MTRQGERDEEKRYETELRAVSERCEQVARAGGHRLLIVRMIWLVSFMRYDLAFFDHETCRIESAANPFAAKLSPMSSE